MYVKEDSCYLWAVIFYKLAMLWFISGSLVVTCAIFICLSTIGRYFHCLYLAYSLLLLSSSSCFAAHKFVLKFINSSSRRFNWTLAWSVWGFCAVQCQLFSFISWLLFFSLFSSSKSGFLVLLRCWCVLIVVWTTSGLPTRLWFCKSDLLCH